jgi:hypothetical protein
MTLRQALRLLTNSGRRTPDQIAEYLEKKSISGWKGTSDQCPAARFLTKMMGTTAMRVCVFREYIEASLFTRCGIRDQRIPTPANLTRFVCNFDDNLYPKLVGG